MSGNPGGLAQRWTPTPPERGSFPLDHDGDCTDYMKKYLQCLKLTKSNNAPNCRILARDYLGCRMDHKLMETTPFADLGLPEERSKKVKETKTEDKI